MKLVALVHVAAYPVLVWLAWTWLGIAESSAAALAGSLVLGVVIILALSWLLATAFDGDLRVRSSWVRSLLFVAVALAAVGATLWLAGYRPAVTDWLAAKLSSAGRAQNPRRFDAFYIGGLWLAFGLVVAMLLPSHYLRTTRVLRNWRYWLACLALVVAGGYLPWKLATWVPAAKTLATQAASMGVRFAIAYLISVTALLVFASIVRRLAIPREPTPAT